MVEPVIKLTNKMRESLVKTSVYSSARALYKYNSFTRVVVKYTRDGSKMLEAAYIDLNRWALLKSYDEENSHEKT